MVREATDLHRNRHAIDVHIGLRLRQRRKALEMSRAALAGSLNISIEYLEDYELGMSRIGPSRLLDMAELLGVPIGFFYQSPPEALKKGAARTGCAKPETTGLAEPPQTNVIEIEHWRRR